MSENNEKQLSGISKAGALDAIAGFWDNHSLADYWEQTREAGFIQG